MLSTPADPTTAPPATHPTRQSWFFNPYVQISLCILCGTVAEVLLKKGAAASTDLTGAPAWLVNLHHTAPWLGVTGLYSGWTWLSIVFTLLSLFAWISAIRVLPIGVAFSLTNAVQVLVALSCWIFLGEGITPRRWCGIVLVVTGLTIVAKPYSKIDERL